jgi:DNA end-binding protein Ku
MSARAIGSGTLSFGLVSIPVKLYSAAESAATISFNLLHAKCSSRLKQQYICTKDGELVARDQMVKGYEFAKDQYVTFTPEELKALEEEANKAIEIAEFLPASTVDPLFFDGGYYLGPDKGAEKAYRLLAQAMIRTGRAALAKWISRGRQHLVLIRPIDQGLVMHQLHYADEIRAFAEVPVGEATVKEAELKLGVQLIEQIATDEFKPQQYQDEVRQRMHASIQRKVEGQEIMAAPVEQPKAQIIDLMEALKASLAAKGEGKAAAGRKPAKRAPVAEKPARAARESGKKSARS